MYIENAVNMDNPSQGRSLLERFGVSLRALLMALSMTAMAWGLTTYVGVVAGVLGAVAGVYLGDRLARTRIRTWVFFVGMVIGQVASALLAMAFGSWSWLVTMFGSPTSLQMAEICWWGGGALTLLGGLRAIASRSPAWVSVELMLPLFGAASLFASHRDNSIHRPQYLVDWALERGEDPTWYLLLIGVGAALLMVFGLIRIRQRRQLLGVAVLIFLLITSVLWFFSNKGSAQLVKLVNGMSGKGDQKGKAKKGKSKGGRSRKDRQNEMPFDPPPQQQQQPRPEPVAVVVFRDDYTPKQKVLYFRQRALSFFNGLRMEKGSHPEIHKDTLAFFPDEGVVERLYAPANKSVQGKDGKPMPHLGGTRKRVRTRVSLLREHTNPFGLLDPLSFQTIPNPNPRVFVRAYEVDSLAFNDEYKLTLKVGNSKWSKDLWKHYTAAPHEQAYKDLLAEILGPIPEKFANNLTVKAFLIKMWLDKHILYSLRPPSQERAKLVWEKNRARIEKGNPWLEYLRNNPTAKRVSFPDPRYEQVSAKQDPVGHFLFRSRIGYCVHIAHASVFLMRLAGIPARIGEGYAVPDANRGSTSSLLIRDNEAHAWPELYFEGVGWVPLDPSPQALRDQRQTPPDPQLRQTLAKLSRNTPPPPPKIGALKNPKEKPDPILRRRGPIRINLFPLLLALILGVYLLKFGRRYAFWIVAGKERRVQWFLMALEDRFCELGMRRPPGEPLEIFADRFVEAIPALRPIVEQLAASRLGSRLPSKIAMGDLWACQTQLLKAFAWYRHIVAFVDPISWSFHIFDRWRVLPPAIWVRWQTYQAKRRAKKAEKAEKKRRLATKRPATS
ncbi:MAG: hypothetical protein H6728_17320 [Myxococcales bacterium]|nr:hypothetical protein [Myxococcales bacterium]MCB9644834.1 hypothetical protein [Myxococcales bacterium]